MGRCVRRAHPGGDPGADQALDWLGNVSVSPSEELEEVAGERIIWISLLRLLTPHLDPEKCQETNKLSSH